MQLRNTLGFIFFLISFSNFSQQLYINEVSQGDQSKEYIEFIVAGNPTCQTPVPCLDLRWVIIDDNNGEFAGGSGTGIAQGAVRFANIPFWSCVPQGTLIVIYNNIDKNPLIPSDDNSLNDGNCRLVIPINSNLLEGQGISPTNTVSNYPTSPSSWLTSGGDWNHIAMSNSNDSFQIRNSLSNSSAFHAVSWGNNTQNNHIYFSGNAASTVFLMDNSTSNDPANQLNWISGTVGTDETPGSANNTANASWIGSMNPECGTPSNLSITTSTTPTDCGATCTGTATVMISGGAAPYTVLWSNNESAASISNLCQGAVSVTVTDDGGCIVSDIVTVTSNGSAINITTSFTNENCFGDCDGQISSTVSGGNPPYTYSWSNGQATEAIYGLCSGQYSLLVSDFANCTNSVTLSISDLNNCLIPEYFVKIPNTFTPNNDFVNDIYELSISGGKLETGVILNRWGITVHEFSPENLKWNGQSQKGVSVSEGVYSYVITIRKADGILQKYHGFITLVK